MDDRLAQRLEGAEAAYEETLVQMADPDILSDQQLYREVSTRHAELKPIVEAYRSYRDTAQEIKEASELASGDNDDEMAAYLADTVTERRRL